jgi:hypothetical protein
LNEATLKLKIFSSLPIDDSSIFHREIIDVILDILESVALGLLNEDSTEEEDIQMQSLFSAADGYDTCLYLLNVYEDKKYKERIAIILGKFYYDLEIPKKGIIIIDIFLNSLKDYNSKGQNKSEENHILNLLRVIADIITNERNKQIFFDKRIMDILLVLISNSQNPILPKAVSLLMNICSIPSVEAKNTIIKKDIFNILHKRLSELSPSPPQQMKPDDYYSVYYIVDLVNNLLSSNPSGVIPFLNSPLIPVFSWTLESSMSLLSTSSDKNIQDIFRFICLSFSYCAQLPYENVIRFMEMRRINRLILRKGL